MKYKRMSFQGNSYFICMNSNCVKETLNISDWIMNNKRFPELFLVCSLPIQGLLPDPVVQCPCYYWIRQLNATPLVYLPETFNYLAKQTFKTLPIKELTNFAKQTLNYIVIETLNKLN